MLLLIKVTLVHIAACYYCIAHASHIHTRYQRLSNYVHYMHAHM